MKTTTAWECSGLSLAAFDDLVDSLVSSGRAVRHRDLLVFPNLKTAALAGRPRRRRRS